MMMKALLYLKLIKQKRILKQNKNKSILFFVEMDDLLLLSTIIFDCPTISTLSIPSSIRSILPSIASKRSRSAAVFGMWNVTFTLFHGCIFFRANCLRPKMYLYHDYMETLKLIPVWSICLNLSLTSYSFVFNLGSR